MPLTPGREDYKGTVRAYHESTPVHRYLGMELGSIEPGRVIVAMPVRAEFTQQNGFVHAGILTALADAAAGMAAWSLIGEKDNLLSVSIAVSLMRAAKADCLTAEGRVVKAGERVMFCEASVWATDDPERRELVRASFTIAVVGDR
ncbi:PaaI family thioesterase [bacterium]|nr:PaaI family thioesterase [bacterium]